MKQPNLNNIMIDSPGTKKLRAQLKRTKKIKITINIDERSLTLLKRVSGRSALPYQQILRRVLEQTGSERDDAKSRLDRIERELEKLKRQIAA